MSRRTRNKASNAGRITCKTCGMIWDDRLEFMKDRTKCGSVDCKMLSTADRNNLKESYAKEDGNKPSLVTRITTGTIPDKHEVPAGEQRLYLPVPKVIVIEVRRG